MRIGSGAGESKRDEPLRVLVAEDSEVDARLLLRELQAGGFAPLLTRIDSADAMAAALERQEWDLVISDYHMPAFSGTAALELARRHRPHVPFIFVSGTIGEEVAVEAMRAGARDYVMKGNLRRLVPAIQRELEQARSRAERQRARAHAALQQDVTWILSAAATPAEACSRVLALLAGELDCDFARAWLAPLNTTGLECVAIWPAQAVPDPTSHGPPPGESLANRVFQGEGVLWMPRLDRELQHLNGLDRLDLDLRTGCAFPILNGPEAVGVIELFATRPRPEDPVLHALLGAAGTQLGQFVVRRRTEVALDLAQSRLQRVLASSTAVVYSMQMADGHFTPVWISENLPRLLGYSVAEALRPGWWLDHVHEEDRSSVLAEVTRQPHTGSMEYRFQHRDGGYRWIHDQFTLVLTADRPPELFGAWLDVTERRSLEEQFHQAQKMEAVGRLAGGVAHDFNNLLTIISAHVSFLREDLGAEAPQQEDVAAIEQAAGDAAALTRQLLAFSRQQVLEPRVLDLNRAVTESERMLRRLIGEDIDLVTMLDPDLGQVRADPGQIGQVLMNLAVNARDAMPEGGKLTIATANLLTSPEGARTQAVPGPWPCIALSITDTGVGMTEETRARIFEPFFTTKEVGKGTGLGLATVYGIVKQSGGFIRVDSQPGQGTRFQICLPRVDAPVEWAGATDPAPGIPRGTETVLVVEDAAEVRTVAVRILERQGYRVLEAADGEVATRLTEGEPGTIDLLVTDVVMPGLGGRRLATALCARRPHMRVLFASGYTDDAILQHGVLEPGVAYLQKPFTPESLARKVREVLDAPCFPNRTASGENAPPTHGEP